MKLIVKVDNNYNLLVRSADKLALQKTFKKDDILECSVKQDNKLRSLPEHRLYWQLMTYCSRSMPEIIHRTLDIVSFTPNMIHDLCKAKMNISSTAFNKMAESEFNHYFKLIQEWLAQYFFRCTADDLMHGVMEEK